MSLKYEPASEPLHIALAFMYRLQVRMYVAMRGQKQGEEAPLLGWKDRIFIERMPSDRKLKASRKGSK